MKKIIFLLALLFALVGDILLPACHKDPPELPVVQPVVLPDTLPPLTATGANTFGCYVNGKLWLPKADWRAYADPSFQMIQSSLVEKNGAGGYLTIEALFDNVRETFSFGLPCKKGVFHTNIKGETAPNNFSVWFLDYYPNKWYYPDYSILNTKNCLEVTHLDTLSNIISGTFNVTIYRGWSDKITNRKDSLVIKDGRFDVKYAQ